MDILDHTAVEIGALIDKGEISSQEALDALYKRIAQSDKEINAYITVSSQSVPEAWGKMDEGAETTQCKLRGVPIAIKDNICTRGILTTCASKILSNYIPAFDATVVEKVRRARMPIVGKLNMDEFAMGSTNETSYYGSVKNPIDYSRVPGGSSGGAAAAVASGEAICALGSDTGGSIRQPAAYCGVTGFKPTYGSVSRYGLIAYASSLDQIGPIAHDVADCAALMDVIAGHDVHDSTSSRRNYPSYFQMLDAKIKGKKIGIPDECFGTGVDEDVRASVLACAKTLERLGAILVPIRLPFMEYVVPTYYIIATAEASSNLSRFDGVKYGFRAKNVVDIDSLYVETRSQGFGKEVQMRILLGTFVLSSGYYNAYYRKALLLKQKIIDGFSDAFRECDAIICPVAPTTAPKLGDSLNDSMKMYLSDIFTVSVNLAGLPALSIPCGKDRLGLPIGAQLIGPAWQDGTILNLGYAFQRVTTYHQIKK